MKLKYIGLNVIDLIKCKYHISSIAEQQNNDNNKKYFIISASPATGILFATQSNLEFISGHVRLRGRDEGRYPYNYLQMIDNIFGKEENTVEVCSRSVKGGRARCECRGGEEREGAPCFTVDINPETKPDLVTDGQKLDGIPNNRFNRWRYDPPYNPETAKKM